MMISMFIASFLTSALSAITGMGGGVILLAFLANMLPFNALVPIHGLVQLCANSFRIFFLRQHVHKNFVTYFILGVPFGAMASVFLLKNYINETIVYTMLFILITYSLIKPKKMPQVRAKGLWWSLIGLFAGSLAILIGSVGPFLSVFYVRDDLQKEQIIATKSTMQMICHFIKIPSFLYLGFNYVEYINPFIIMVIAGLIGTKVGLWLLGRASEKTFKRLFKFCLFIASVRILTKVIDESAMFMP